MSGARIQIPARSSINGWIAATGRERALQWVAASCRADPLASRIPWYICAVDETYGPEELRRPVASEIGKNVEEAIVTSADILGAQGQREMLLKQLGKRFGVLPADAVVRVNAAEPGELEALFDRLFTAPTLAEVLAEG